MFGIRPRRVNPDPMPPALPAPPKPVGYSDPLARPVELPNAKPVAPRFAYNPATDAPALSSTPTAGMPAPEADAAIPKFGNRYDEMKWRGGVGGYENSPSADKIAAAEWNHMTRGGKFNPTQPTGKDRLREALMTGLYGLATGAAQTGTISGALGGAAVGAGVGAFSPETARAMTFEPQRQQLMQRQHDQTQMEAEKTHAEALRAGLEGTRAKTKETVQDMQIKEAMSKSEIDARAQKMILDAALNKAQVQNQTSQAGQHDAQANYYGVQAGEHLAKLPGEISKQRADLATEQLKQREIQQRIVESQAKTPWEIARIRAQVESEYAQAANARETTYGKQQLNQGEDMKEEEIADFAAEKGMTVMQAKRLLRGSGILLPRPPQE